MLEVETANRNFPTVKACLLSVCLQSRHTVESRNNRDAISLVQVLSGLDYAWSRQNNCYLQNMRLFCISGENRHAVIPVGAEMKLCWMLQFESLLHLSPQP